jgi:hypothetical protein
VHRTVRVAAGAVGRPQADAHGKAVHIHVRQAARSQGAAGGFAAIGFIDGYAYKLLSGYVRADDDFCVREIVWPWLRGLEKDRPDAFVGIAASP